MSRKRRIIAWTAPALAVGLAGAMFVLPANADTGEPAKGKSEEQTVKELKLANAWVNPKADLQFGADALADVKSAVKTTLKDPPCQINAEDATALSIAMTWPEVSPEGEPPSPMTLSRFDTQPELGDPDGRADGLWFHPGIGMWQLDSAGLGNDYTAGEAIDTKNSASHMVPYIVGKFCDAVNNGSAAADARAKAWSDWVACGDGACEDTYARALKKVTPVEKVDRYGGGEQRDCDFGGTKVKCLYVDPAKAQGAKWWAAPDGGKSPLAAPFYVYRVTKGDKVSEVRYWTAANSGASTDVQASRPFGSNARDSLTWSKGAGLCDLTKDTGSC